MKKLIILFLLVLKLNALMIHKQLDYLSEIALALKVSNICIKLDYIGIENNYSLYKFIPLKIKTNGTYYHKTNLYKLISLCNEIRKD